MQHISTKKYFPPSMYVKTKFKAEMSVIALS